MKTKIILCILIVSAFSLPAFADCSGYYGTGVNYSQSSHGYDGTPYYFPPQPVSPNYSPVASPGYLEPYQEPIQSTTQYGGFGGTTNPQLGNYN